MKTEEIGLQLRRWDQSREGLGQVVLLSGEAVIGKSSLVNGLRDQGEQILGTACRHQPGAPVAVAGQVPGRLRPVRPGVRMVHGRV